MERHLAYQMIDEAKKGSLFFRFIISPDPRSEDTENDLISRPRNDPAHNVKTVVSSDFVVLCRRIYHMQFFPERNVCDEGTTSMSP